MISNKIKNPVINFIYILSLISLGLILSYNIIGIGESKYPVPVLLTGLTVACMIGIMLIFFNFRFGRCSYKNPNKVTPLFEVSFLLITTLFIRLISLSGIDQTFSPTEIIVAIACALASCFIIYKTASFVYGGRYKTCAAVIYAFWPSGLLHCKGHIGANIAEVFLLLAILLLVQAYITKKAFVTFSSMTVAGVFMSLAVILNWFNIIFAICTLVYCILAGFLYKTNTFKQNQKTFFFSVFIFVTVCLLLIAFSVILGVGGIEAFQGYKDLIPNEYISDNSGDNLLGTFAAADSNMAIFWEGNIYTQNRTMTYFSYIFMVFILVTAIMGIITALRRQNCCELILAALAPIFMSVFCCLIQAPVAANIYLIPLLIPLSAYGLTVSFSYIALPLDTRFNEEAKVGNVTAELNPEFFKTPKEAEVKQQVTVDDFQDKITAQPEKIILTAGPLPEDFEHNPIDDQEFEKAAAEFEKELEAEFGSFSGQSPSSLVFEESDIFAKNIDSNDDSIVGDTIVLEPIIPVDDNDDTDPKDTTEEISLEDDIFKTLGNPTKNKTKTTSAFEFETDFLAKDTDSTKEDSFSVETDFFGDSKKPRKPEAIFAEDNEEDDYGDDIFSNKIESETDKLFAGHNDNN